MAFPTTSLEMRYEAKDESSYTDGNVATTVTDQSGNSRDLSGTGLTWQSSELNGHAVYRLDGQDDVARLASAAGGIHNAWSASIVVKATSEGSSRTWPFSVGDSTGQFMTFTEGATASEWGIFARTDGVGGADSTQFTSGVDTTVWTHLLLVWDGANVTFYRDGSQVDTEALAGDLRFEDIDLGELTTSEFFGGDVALAAAWSKALDSTERSDLQDYIDTTYFGVGLTKMVLTNRRRKVLVDTAHSRIRS